jgi:hypothetical protein
MTKKLLAIVMVGSLAGCAPGLLGGGNPSDPNLDRVLLSDRSVPARQGLLYMAMQDAEVAIENAGWAMTADHPDETKARINNVLYAMNPEFPPAPTVTSFGLAGFWPGTGYGLRRSVQGIADQMREVGSRHGSREVVADQAGQVVTCAEETLARTDRVVGLGQQALAASSAEQIDPLVAEMSRLTHIIMEAPAAQEANACSLEHAKRYLNSLALQLG